MAGNADPSGRAAVRKLARGSLVSRFRNARKPLKLIAVPRDHVPGDRKRGDALLAGRLMVGASGVALDDPALFDGTLDPVIAERVEGFSWLRDLAAATGRDKGAKLAEAIIARWLVAHGAKADAAWAPHLWGERLMFWTTYAPYVLSSTDAGYRSALLNTIARGARHLEANADKAPEGLKRVTAWCGAVATALVVQGAVPRLARAESGLARALAGAQFDDGGLISRAPAEQALLVDRLGLLRSFYAAARQVMPDGIEAASAAALAALHGVTMGDGALSSWQGGHPWLASRMLALVEGCGLRARPLRQARGWGYQRMSALGTVLVIDSAPPPPARMASGGSASTLAFELSDGGQRLVVNCGGPGLLPTELPDSLIIGLRSTAAHSTLVLDDTNSTAIQPDGMIGRGVEDVLIERSEDNDASRLEASHDGYVRRFGFLHKRSLMLGNDGKELRGLDQLVARGRRKVRDSIDYAVRFHLAPGIEATATADGLGAILRSKGAPPWNFRCRGGQLTIEESLWIDGRGRPQRTSQLVILGQISSLGGEIGWQFRRTS